MSKYGHWYFRYLYEQFENQTKNFNLDKPELSSLELHSHY